MMKDNLIDDERAKQEEAAQESMELKLERLGTVILKTTSTRMVQLFHKTSGRLLLQIWVCKASLRGFPD